MERVDLVGFVADAGGDDDHLRQMVPVVRRDGADFTARGLKWSLDSLLPIAEGNTRFVSYFRDSEAGSIEEGQTVWVAGRNFFADVQSIQEAKTSGLGMGQWGTHARGVRWWVGTTGAFREFAQRLATLFENRLHNYLFDSMEKSMGDAAKVFRVYNSLPIEDSRERELNRGLYFGEVRDEYSRIFVRREALKLRLFKNGRDYDRSLEALRVELVRRRLSEGSVHGSMLIQSGGDITPTFAQLRRSMQWTFQNEWIVDRNLSVHIDNATREDWGAEVETGASSAGMEWRGIERG